MAISEDSPLISIKYKMVSRVDKRTSCERNDSAEAESENN